MTELEEYTTTGMLGSYQPGRAALRQMEDGSVSTIFRDTTYSERNGYNIHERKMLVGGKCFHISSVFPGDPVATPTDKMLEFIDAELKKDSPSK